MSKRISNILILSGVIIKVTDMIRPGTFLNGGFLTPLDVLPKVTVGPVTTDLGVWLILAGGVGRLMR
jgi:hypothetical protein